MATDIESIWRQAFEQCGAFARDTTLPPGFLEKYEVGMLLREPTYCDASHKIGGFVAPHRFLMISPNARCIDTDDRKGWGLCIWPRGTFFKVIDKVSRDGRTQISLLDIPEPLLKFFASNDPSQLEQTFALQARMTFEKCVAAPPIPELDTEEWRQRLVYPVGLDDHGAPFPHSDGPPQGASDLMTFEIVGSLPAMAGDEIEVVDEIRRGDVVRLDRVAPNKVAIRVMSAAEAGEYVGQKFRIERGGQPGAIRLIEVEE